MTIKKLESFGGVGSILTGLVCVGIGWMDYTTGQSWHIWAIMFVVLTVNGVLMLASASRRREVEGNAHPRKDVLSTQNGV